MIWASWWSTDRILSTHWRGPGSTPGQKANPAIEVLALSASPKPEKIGGLRQEGHPE